MVLKKPNEIFRCLLSRCNFLSNDIVSKNTMFFLLTLSIAAAAGFLFTIIAAQMYTIESVGVAALLLSYASIVILITRFGTEQSMIRYYREGDKSSIFWSSVFITTISAVLLSLLLIIISYSGIFGIDYLFMYSVVFIISVTIFSINQVCGGLFLASGKTILYFIQNSIISSRFILLFVFIPFGVLGIFSSLTIVCGVSAIFSFLLLFHFGLKLQMPDKKFLEKSFHYSMSNYLSDCLLAAPVYLIPIVVFYLLGHNETAVYSVSYAFASIAFIVPVSIGYAFFMSGCQEKTTITSMKNMIWVALIFLIGITLLFIFLGKEIVNLLGPEYSGAYELIVIIMSSSFFALAFQIYSAEFKIFKQMKKILILNCIFFVAVMTLSFFFIMNLGLVGAGYAWIAAYAICVVPMIFYPRLIKKGILSWV